MNPRRLLWILCLLLAALPGCRHGRHAQDTDPSAYGSGKQEPLPPIPEERPMSDGVASGLGGVLFEAHDGRYLDAQEAADAFAAFKLDRLDPAVFDLPVVVTDQVLLWMLYFSDPAKGTFERWVGRSAQWGPMIRATLAEEGLPQDLLFLAMIESGFVPTAFSPVYAAGLWQFMKPTARAMGLSVDAYVDERLDPEKATQAAARYITYLYKKFGDWPLAMAAYNGGEGRVGRAIKRTGVSDYWALCRMDALPTETCNYVPKIMAAMILGDDPARYGFSIEPLPPMIYDIVEVPGGVALDVVGLCTDSDAVELAQLNPELRRPFTPPSRALYPVKVPLGSSEGFMARFESLPKEKRTGAIHVVASGENLWVIARTYGVTVDDLLIANNIKDARKIQIGAELVVPGFTMIASKGAPPASAQKSGGSTSAAKASAAKASPRPAASAPRGKATTHRVDKGESLWSIAQHYGVSVADLQAWNGLKGSGLQAGQSLKIYGAAQAGTSTYTVKAGDSLWTIAHRHGMSVDDIRRINKLTTDALHPGDTLRVRPGTATGQARYHTVSQGESLWALSRQYDVDVDSLRRWNNLSTDRLQPGDRLKVSP